MSGLVFLALGISFFVGLILCPFAIPLLKRLKFGQYIREEGPEAHKKKAGTPTMGGVVILIAFAAGTLVTSLAGFAGAGREAVAILIFTFAFGIIGFIDDFLKITKHENEGLKPRQKMLLQIVIAAALIIYVAKFTEAGTYTIIPFAGEFNIGGWYYVLAAFAVLGTVNGANFTDGIDGLASSVTIVIAAFLTIAAAITVKGAVPATLAMAGALLAFLIFNFHPARVFMGDTGSLALGGFVAATALILKIPVFLILAAFIYLMEIVTVIMQVAYFKATHGKRIFKMTPIHHHFELSGWSEIKIVIVFTLITVVLCGLAYLVLAVAVG